MISPIERLTSLKRAQALPATGLLVLIGCLAAVGNAQEALPKAEQVLDQYVEAIGGLAALEKINNRVTKATIEISGAGIKLSSTIYQARPDKSYTVIESPATGKMESGSDGDVVWEMSAIAGPQIKEGRERAESLHLNTFDRLAHWRKVYKQVETAGIEDVGGKPCYKVVVTPFNLPQQALFFDKESRLLVKASMTIETQAGTIPFESYLSDYKREDGILMWRRNVTKVMGQERIVSVDSIEQNVDLPADRFALPPEIKALIKKNQ